MPEQQMAPSTSLTSVVTVRPVRYVDLVGVNVGDEDVVLYRLRDHAGDLSLDRAEITRTRGAPVYRQHRRPPDERERVGRKISIAVQTVYGSEVNIHLYDNPDALDVDYPPDRDGAAAASRRERALARQSDPGVYIEDPDGAMTLPVTPDWGSQAYLSVLVPDLDPDALAVAITRTLDEQFPGHRLVKLRSRWAAERRVNIYRPPLPSGAHERDAGLQERLLESNLLEAEAVAFGRSFRVEQVSPLRSDEND